MSLSRLVLVILFVACLAVGALAADFRVDNTAYVTGQKGPPIESTTIFQGGTVFDYMTSPAETVVFEPAAGRFILLNVKSRTRAELTSSELTAFTDRLQQVASKSSESRVRFLAAPKFQERFDAKSGDLTLSSTWFTYRVMLTTTEDPAAAEQYHEFSDWYARLNALLSPGSRPPFARLVVNAAVAQRKALPSQVVLTISPSKTNNQPIVIHSTHRVVRPLMSDDLDRVSKTRKSMTEFKQVSFEKYRKLEPH